jgi:hypothetical protein
MENNEVLLAWLGVLSVFFFVASVVAIPIVVAWIPEDYFERKRIAVNWKNPATWIRRILKNALGGFFFLAGILMLFLPGQGLLSILLGVSLLDFPSKRRVQLYLFQKPAIHRSVDWIRRKANRPPLRVPQVRGS